MWYRTTMVDVRPGTALIKHGTGKYKNQFRFVLYGANGKIIGTGEHYSRKENTKKTLKRYFPDFKIQDQTV